MATSLKIDDDLKARVKLLAVRRERSPHWIMHEAIRDFVEREEARDDFVAEALASWNAYRETGRHLSGDEVASWLETWGTADETSAPPLPRLIVSEGAVAGIERCRRFLAERNTAAVLNAAREIARSFAALSASPFMGRPYRDQPGLRELVIRFGGSGYVALYRYDEVDDAVVVLAFRHQREAGY